MYSRRVVIEEHQLIISCPCILNFIRISVAIIVIIFCACKRGGRALYLIVHWVGFTVGAGTHHGFFLYYVPFPKGVGLIVYYCIETHLIESIQHCGHCTHNRLTLALI